MAIIHSIARPPSLHADLVGKVAMLHPLAIEINNVYKNNYGYGYGEHKLEDIMAYQLYDKTYRFIFIGEEPDWRDHEWFYCVQVIGGGYKTGEGDWMWFCLSQLIVCV